VILVLGSLQINVDSTCGQRGAKASDAGPQPWRAAIRSL